MGEIIVIRTSDPDGSIFRSILGAYREKMFRFSMLLTLSLLPDSGRYSDIPRAAAGHEGRCGDLPELRRVLYPLLHGPLPWSCIQPGAALQCGLG